MSLMVTFAAAGLLGLGGLWDVRTEAAGVRRPEKGARLYPLYRALRQVVVLQVVVLQAHLSPSRHRSLFLSESMPMRMNEWWWLYMA